MLQSIAAWFLQSYLREYIENLDSKYLSVGYGGLELRHLILKKSAIDKLKLPVTLVSGVIGQFHLVIPYANPNTQPWIVKIKQLHIILQADSKIPSPPTDDEIEEIKKQTLNKLEAEWKSNMEKDVKRGWFGSWMPSFYSSLSSSIVDNLVLEIEDVHIRYQCKDNLSFGITIGSLCSKSSSTDGVSTQKSNIKTKSLELIDLSVDFDESCHIKKVEESKKLKIETKTNILGPVCASTEIKRNISKSSLEADNGPRFCINVVFDSISLVLSKLQMQTAVHTYEDITRYFRSLNHHEKRPTVSVKSNAKTWWQFAINAILEPIKVKNKNSTKTFILKRLKDINTYVAAYKKYLTSNDALDQSNKDVFIEIEKRIRLEELIILRKVIFTKIVADKNAKKRAASTLQSKQQTWGEWATSFYWSNPSIEKESPPTTEDLQMTKEEKEFLDSLTEGIDSEDESVLKRDSIFAKFHFLLKTGSFVLQDSKGDNQILDFSFHCVNLTTEARPKSKLFEWSASLGNVKIKNTGKLKHVYPCIVAPQSEKNDENFDFLQFKFSQKEIQWQTEYSLFVNLQPSIIIYQHSFLKNIISFFNFPSATKYNISSYGMTEKLQETLHTRFEELKKATQNEFSSALVSLTKTQREASRWNIQLDIAAPSFLIPVETNPSSEKMVLLSLGNISFSNQHGGKSIEDVADDNDDEDDEDEFLTPSSTPPEDECAQIDTSLPESVIREKFYDSYTLKLTKLQVLTCSTHQDWIGLHSKGYGPGHIIEEFSVSLVLKRRTLFTADPEYPALILSGELPQLFFHIDQEKLSVINSCVDIFSAKEQANSKLIPAASKPAKDSVLPDDVSKNTKNFKDLVSESKLFQAEFLFKKLSFALHSCGRCFAELQINGVECKLSKQPYSVLATFIVSSIRLVDAIQTFGQDYELLISSYSQKSFSNTDVLMYVSYEQFDANHPSSCDNAPSQIVHFNMNSLHINGNLETIVELNNIVKQLTNNGSYNSPYRDRFIRLSESYGDENSAKKEEADKGKLTISGHFNEISLLIFRTHYVDYQKHPLKIANLTIRQLEVTSSLDNSKNIAGSIGSILLEDLSPGCLFYTNILSIGNTYDASSPIKMSGDDISEAFKFKYTDSLIDGDKIKSLHLNMASLYFFHNPSFLCELLQYAGDYKTYAYNLAKSIQTAATDMAKSIVLTEPDHKQMTSEESFKRAREDLSYFASIETPVVLFPQSRNAKQIVIGRLGKITISNEVLTQPTDMSLFQKIYKRINIDIDKINLSVGKFDLEKKVDFIEINTLLEIVESSQTQVIHNIDIKLAVDKSLSSSHENLLELNGCINSPLKLFLSLPIYNALLATLSYATFIKQDSIKSPPVTPSASSSQLQMKNESSWQIDSSSNAESMEDGNGIDDIDTMESQKLSACFHIPSVEIELHGEIQGKSHGFVIILFHDFEIRYNNSSHPYSTFNLALQNFSIEDLLYQGNDKYKYLVSSTQEVSFSRFANRTCSSCPEDNDLFGNEGLSKSMPNLWLDGFKKDRSISMESFGSSEMLDVIPESSPLINIEIIVAKVPDADTQHDEVKKSIIINLNSIDFVINLQTWVILLEFFGIGAAPTQPQQPENMKVDKSEENISETQEVIEEEMSSSETELQVTMRSVGIYLSKEEYPLAKANANAMNLHITLHDGNQDISGSIGNISLSDLSLHAGYYRQRLVSVGDTAIDFSFFRFGKPDPYLNRDLDMELTLSMSAIEYVHTQRFLMETISFFQHFVFLQEVLGRIRAASQGNEVSAAVNRAARLLLKVNADAPILFLPHKSSSRNCLVCNLGKLAIKNEFIYSDDPRTNGYSFSASRYRSNIGNTDEEEIKIKCRRLLDCININFTAMHILSALKIDGKSSESTILYEEQGCKMMSDSFSLQIDLERNLEWMFGRQVPDMSLSGVLSSVSVNVDLSQYSLIMGILGDNFGEQMDAFEAPSSVLIDPLVLQPNTQVWTGMRIKLNLLNVSMVISPTFSFGDILQEKLPSEFKKLAQFDFKNSMLIYESFTDGSKSIDLVSSDVLVFDVRTGNNISVLLQNEENKTDNLQFEVHYLDTSTKSFLTFLCNQSRIFLLFDFFIDVWNFISRKEEQEYNKLHSPPSLNKTNQSIDFELASPSIVTKTLHTRLPSEAVKTFELKVNITESELVMVEDIGIADTQTVIMKLTAVLAYKPGETVVKPVNCSIQNLEIFSCLLNQSDSALSILDPVACLVELKMPHSVLRKSVSGLPDAIKVKPVLEIQFQSAVGIRLSYHDVQIFLSLLRKTQNSISQAMLPRQQTDESMMTDLEASLNVSGTHHMNVSRTGSSNVSLSSTTSTHGTSTHGQTTPMISGFEVKGNMISVVLIDDSGNNDVPLIELLFADLLFNHSFDVEWKGLAKCHIDSNYYNTRVSAWEPFIETWKFNIVWHSIPDDDHKERAIIKLDAPDRLDMNLTTSFINIAHQTATSWSASFLTDDNKQDKKRAPFLPFLLRNRTGSKLVFYTTHRSPTRSINRGMRESTINDILDTRYEVESGKEISFTFEKRSKIRHQGSHQLLVHQIVLQIQDWCRTIPLTVDRVGLFFRILQPESFQKEGEDAYIIFDISVEGARKVITVKSALTLINNLHLPVEVVAYVRHKYYALKVMNTQETYNVPLNMIRAKLFLRPLKNNITFNYSNEPISWYQVTSSDEKGFLMMCKSSHDPQSAFRFFTLIKSLCLPKGDAESHATLSQPEHIVSIENHVLLENCLPVEVFYFLRGSLSKELVKPGQQIPLFLQNPHSPFEIGFSFENFPVYDLVKIVLDGENVTLPARVYDTQNRVLILSVLVTFRCGTLMVSIFSPFWLINKTGIPLIFRREGESEDISGQFAEHEEARSLTPLMFSFITSENPYQCLMRIGKKYKQDDDLKPLWSKPFSFDRESDFRTLYVKLQNNQLERSYDVGIYMTWAKGRFNKTKVVSFVPRYQIENLTSHTLLLTQRYLLKDTQSVGDKYLTTCYPDTVSFFHWYRSDIDQIACVKKLEDQSSLWSGGIKFDSETSYFVNVKSSNRKTRETFFRVDVSYNSGTFRCTFSDASHFPPPFRILNLSEVSLFYWQELEGNSQMNSFIKAKEAKDYVLDEPALPAKLTLSVYNESSETYDLCVSNRHCNKLYYQNGIYIAFTHTFHGSSCSKHTCEENTNRQMVLEVMDGKNVILAHKQPHKPSQLWRMNLLGNLIHFGTSPSMKTSRKSSFSTPACMVLDVEERFDGTKRHFFLVLKEKTSQREDTQTWFFESNMLHCCIPGLVVHCPDRFEEKALVKLGPKPSPDEITSFFYSCISRQNMRPGSGVLSVRTYSHGPTHVIEITDSQHDLSAESWILLNQSETNARESNLISERSEKLTEVALSLAGGLGISFINFKPEELIFATLSQIQCGLEFTKTQSSFTLEIGTVQVDNQLFTCQIPVAVFPLPQSKKTSSKPANLFLSFIAEKDDSFDLHVFKEFRVDICKFVIEVEDRLVLKIIEALQHMSMGDKSSERDISNIFDSHKIEVKRTDWKNKMFFEKFLLNQGELRLSLLATGKIDSELSLVKKSLGIPFVSFENAAISFDQFQRTNILETRGEVLGILMNFYKDSLVKQAAVLLGSLDILGNPMGLFHDFSSGVQGLVRKGNIGGLFVNVAHGFSDSAAKMTGVIADNLWSASMDNKFQESRDSWRVARTSSSSSHLSAGLKGFGMGMIGGLTSMITQPIEGASKKGVSGFLSGIGKGVVGTIAKPVAGVLDFASGTAAAVRTKTETQLPTPNPVRLKRNCYGAGGVLGRFHKQASEGQEILLRFNEGDMQEMFVSMEVVRPSTDRLKAILTNKGIYFVKSGPPCNENIKLHIEYSRLIDAQYYGEENYHYIEMFLCKRKDYLIQEQNLENRTTVRCETKRVAYKVAQKTNYLKSLYEETLFVVPKTN